MAALSSLILGASALAGLAGTGVAAYGSYKANQGAERAEEVRNKQMKLQADRDRRASIRQAVIARSQATSNATSQGAGEATGLKGGLAQIGAVDARNQRDIGSGVQLGEAMFSANRQISSGQTMQTIGQAIQGFGSTIADQFDVQNRVWKFQTS